MTVDLLPFPWILQYPTVAHHSTVDTLRCVAAILPVVQHLPVSRRVEDRKSLHQCCWHRENRINLEDEAFTKILKSQEDLVAEPLTFFGAYVIAPAHIFRNSWLVWKKEKPRGCMCGCTDREPPLSPNDKHLNCDDTHMSRIRLSKILLIFCLGIFLNKPCPSLSAQQLWHDYLKLHSKKRIRFFHRETFKN